MKIFVRIYSRIKRKKKELLLLVCTLLLFFLFFEGLLRIFYSTEMDPYYDKGIGLVGPIVMEPKNPNFPLELIPNSEANIGGVSYKINSKGLRDYEHSYEKQENTLRILIMGDSVTMGYAVDFNDTYPKQLEKLLKNNVEVLNFGIMGYNTWHEFELLKEEGIKYKPDMIIFGYVLNDLERDIDKIVKNDTSKRICYIDYFNIKISCELENNLRKIRTFTFFKYRLNNLLQQKKDKDYYKELYYERNSISDFDEVFKEISQFSEDTNIPVLFVIFPLIFSDYEQYPYENIHQDLAAEMNKYNLTFIDILDDYSQSSKPLYVFKSDSAHPNGNGNMIVAKAIYEFYQKENFLNKSS